MDVRSRRPMPQAPAREPHSLFLGSCVVIHLYVNLLDYIPHKATAVPLFLALSVSRRICRASHELILAVVSWCPGRPPASPRILSDFRVESSICPGGSPVRRHLHSPNPITRVESNALNFSRHSGVQDFIGLGTNE